MASLYRQFRTPDSRESGGPGSGDPALDGPVAAVVIDQVSKIYRHDDSPLTALQSIDLEVRQGEFLTILGPSGCGKTTLLRLLAGLEEPTSGRVLLDGVDIVGLAPEKRPMSMVFQSYALFPNLRVYDNIAYGLRAAGIAESEIFDRVGVVASIMDIAGLEDRMPNELSGGQQQRVALARSVVVRPRVLLLDEPLSSLDARLRDQIRSELRRIQRQLGVTSIYVTHDQSEAMVMSDRIVVMSRGKIEQVGTPEEVYREPKSLFVADFIGQTNVARCEIRRRGVGTLEVLIFGLRASVDDPGIDGLTATIIVRPEDLEISELDKPNDHTSTNIGGQIEVSGWLRSVEYVGASSRLGVELSEGSLVFVVANHTASDGPGKLPMEGQGVLVKLPVSALRAVAS